MNNNKVESIEVYKYVFNVPKQDFTVLIEAENKLQATHIFMAEYPKMFEMDFNIMHLNREITGNRTELLYL